MVEYNRLLSQRVEAYVSGNQPAGRRWLRKCGSVCGSLVKLRKNFAQNRTADTGSNRSESAHFQEEMAETLGERWRPGTAIPLRQSSACKTVTGFTSPVKPSLGHPAGRGMLSRPAGGRNSAHRDDVSEQLELSAAPLVIETQRPETFCLAPARLYRRHSVFKTHCTQSCAGAGFWPMLSLEIETICCYTAQNIRNIPSPAWS